MANALDRVAAMSCWSGPVVPEPLGGGISNLSFKVADGAGSYVVRVGDDIPIHQVMRVKELAASRAAHAAGLSPEIVHTEPGAIVMRFIDGTTLCPEDVRRPGMLERIVALLEACHTDVPRHLRGPAPAFWVFDVLRHYAHVLRDGDSVHLGRLDRLLALADELERAVGPAATVFCHNDLLAANLIDDGQRLWLIDWEYGGFNSPLFDLANLASNNELDRDQERHLLSLYFSRAPDRELLGRYGAMKCASLLRETMWSMVSEIHSDLDFDYPAYTRANLDRFEQALSAFNDENRIP